MEDKDIAKALRAKAREWQSKAQALIHAADLLSTSSDTPSEMIQYSLFDHPPTKRDALHVYLFETGPQTRKEIMERGGFKRGTLASLLSKGEPFVPAGNGKWKVNGPPKINPTPVGVVGRGTTASGEKSENGSSE